MAKKNFLERGARGADLCGMKNDIRGREDIQLLIDSFYVQVRKDELIGYIFEDVAKVDWVHHLPVMYDFWEQILFHTGGYSGNPMALHVRLNGMIPLKKEHFDRWLALFTGTVNDHFEGPMAEMARQRALSIATTIRVKIAAA